MAPERMGSSLQQASRTRAARFGYFENERGGSAACFKGGSAACFSGGFSAGFEGGFAAHLSFVGECSC